VAIKICVFASSTTALFFRGLIDACAKSTDPIEWSVIFPQGHFRYVLADIIAKERRLYLFEHFDRYYAALDDTQIEQAMASGEGLVAALMRDKDGYRWLPKAEQMRRGAAMHACYREFLARVAPDYVLFPNMETVEDFVAIHLCQELGIGVLCVTTMRFVGASFFTVDTYETLPRYFGTYTDDDLQAARRVIARFRAKTANEPGNRYPPAQPRKPSLFRRIVVSEYLRWRYERRHSSEETLLMRVTRHTQPLVCRLRRRRFDLTSARYFDVTESKGSLPDKFVFYGLHMTPESSINALEPYYVDQLRPIDALLLALPPGHSLVVKEHPAMFGMRPDSFYRELRRRPGLVLVHPDYDTRVLIARAAVVATVTGTVGLEAYLLGKPCVLFGPNFFAHLCHRAPARHELAPLLRRLATEFSAPTEAEKEIAIAKFVNIGTDFVMADPLFTPPVMANENIEAARACLWRQLERLGVAVSGAPTAGRDAATVFSST
jgi:hypothetical protein